MAEIWKFCHLPNLNHDGTIGKVSFWNHKIVEIGSTQFKLWRLKESPNHWLAFLLLNFFRWKGLHKHLETIPLPHMPLIQFCLPVSVHPHTRARVVDTVLLYCHPSTLETHSRRSSPEIMKRKVHCPEKQLNNYHDVGRYVYTAQPSLVILRGAVYNYNGHYINAKAKHTETLLTEKRACNLLNCTQRIFTDMLPLWTPILK